MDREKFKKGITDIKNIKLSDNDRIIILSKLNQYVENNPINIKQKPVKSEWYSVSSVFTFKHISYAFVLVLLVGVGSIRAVSGAKNSLPGDGLYSLKVNVIEPIEYTMAVGTVAKATVESKNLTERLVEAEALASQGRLTESSSMDIENRVKKHVDTFSTLVANSNNDSSAEQNISDTKIDFEAAISAHAKILQKISEGSSDGKENNNLSKLKDVVVSEAQRVEGGRVAKVTTLSMVAPVQNIVSTTTTETDKTVFQNKKNQIESIIKNTKKNLEINTKNNPKLNKKILEVSNESLKEAESALERANQSHDSGDTESAIFELNNSRRSAREADTSLDASSHVEDRD